jgi:hypothetical protein
MLVKEVSRALEEMAAIIAKLQFVAAELHRAKQLKLKRQREQKPPDEGKLPNSQSQALFPWLILKFEWP